MRESLDLFVGVLKKRLLLLYRYPLNTVAYLFTLYGFFLLVFLGGRTVAGGAFDNSVDSLVVGYFLVTMAFTAYNELANAFSKEASWGTLEQLMMCDAGFGRLATFIAAAQLLVGAFFGGVILVAAVLTTGVTLSVHLPSVVPIILFGVASVSGVGFVFGGAAVLYKRISNLFNAVQFAFIGLVAAPVQQIPALKLLPLTQSSWLLQRVMRDGVVIWELPPTELAILVATGVGYFGLGHLVMLRLVSVARARGVVGHY
ncbi:ABC transporter permease [Halobaculum sp. MBLA0143]|uniref:ABC transporter permease n=1 Tax=Halobaculum sp. MBLA0143 TaxID=3079933 RepID=UPI003526B6F3